MAEKTNFEMFLCGVKHIAENHGVNSKAEDDKVCIWGVLQLFIERFNQVEKPTLLATNDVMYSFAHIAFLDIAKELESIVAPNADDYCDCEVWYDEYEDVVIQEFISLLTKVYTTAEMVDWNAYKKNIEDAIANERLWGLGGSPHAEENIEELKDELELVENKEYSELLAKYDKCVWKDYLR